MINSLSRMKITAVLLFALLGLSLIEAALVPETQVFQFTAENQYAAQTFQANFLGGGDASTIAFNGGSAEHADALTELCISSPTFEIVESTDWSKCVYYLSFKGVNSSSATFVPRLARTYRAIMRSPNLAAATLTLTGNNCENGEFYNYAKNACEAGVVLTTTATNVDLSSGSAMIMLNTASNKFLGKLVLDITSEDVTTYLRCGSAPQPTTEGSDVVVKGPAFTLNYPCSEGYYGLVVVNEGKTVATVPATFTLTECEGGNHNGPNCEENGIPTLDQTANVTQFNGSTSFVFGVNGLVQVGVAPYDGAAIDFQVFAAVGYVPSASNNDWAGCTVTSDKCTVVTTVSLNNTQTDALVYLTIVAPADSQLAAWGSAPCPNCENQSTCSQQAGTYGTCLCNDGYSLINCSRERPGLKPPIIVLIVIGVLLVLTAVVALVAWIISKRKQKNGYESVA